MDRRSGNEAVGLQIIYLIHCLSTPRRTTEVLSARTTALVAGSNFRRCPRRLSGEAVRLCASRGTQSKVHYHHHHHSLASLFPSLSASRRPGYPSYPSPVAPLRCAVLSTLNDRLTSTNNSTGRLALPTCVIAVLVRQQTIIHHHSRDPRHIIQLAIAIHPSRPTLQVLQISTVMR